MTQMNERELELEITNRIISILSNKMPWVSIHDITRDEFCLNHKHVLETCINPELIGMFLSVMYYTNVMNSRGESTVMSDYLSIQGDSKTFYCANSNFYEDMYAHLEEMKVLLDADFKDRKTGQHYITPRLANKYNR